MWLEQFLHSSCHWRREKTSFVIINFLLIYFLTVFFWFHWLLSYIFSRFVSFVRFDLNLSLSCQSYPPDIKSMFDIFNAIFTFLSLIYFSFKNLHILILIATDLDKIFNLVSNINVKINHFLFFCLFVNFRLLTYTFFVLYFGSPSTDHMTVLHFIFFRIYSSKDVHSNPGPSS